MTIKSKHLQNDKENSVNDKGQNHSKILGNFYFVLC